MRCFVTRKLPGPALDRLRQQHDVDVWADRMPPTREQLLTHAQQADGILALLTERIDADLLDACPKLKVISNYAVGVDNVDLEAAQKRNIPVGNTPDVLTEATADLTFALILAVARQLPEAMRDARNGEWGTWEPDRWLGAEVYGATLGVIGLGRIGRAVAKRARGFEMNVLHAGRGAPLEPLLRQADFVTLHTPLTEQTRHLIDADALAQMKPTAFLINTGRGPLVDQTALLRALNDGTIAGAGIDVTDPEPPQRDDPIFTTKNLMVLPHIGSATRAARERMAELAVDNLLAGLAGQPLPHQVG